MPRIRSIKPEFWSSPGVAKMSPLARLAFIGMWNWADDTGRGTYNPRELMGFIFPNDKNMTVAEFQALCAEIRAHVAVHFYTVAERSYYVIPSWKKHQSKHAKNQGSKYPLESDGVEIDPVSMQVIDISAEICRNSGTSSRNSGTSARETAIGTGEQGNRGTEERGEVCSWVAPAHAREPSPAAPPPRNLDELAAACADRLRCERHKGLPAGEVPACRDCQALREADEARTARAQREEKAQRRAEIDACSLCDDNGIRMDGSLATRCSHQNPPSMKTQDPRFAV